MKKSNRISSSMTDWNGYVRKLSEKKELRKEDYRQLGEEEKIRLYN